MTKIPITPSIIKQLHSLAARDDMPQGLKITNKANNIIFNYIGIVGVYYNENFFEDDKYNEGK